MYEETEDALLVNGMLGHYKLWTPKKDQSLTPCLTGEVGGMKGAWENWVVSWHTKNFKDFDTYVDVGANCGYFTFLASYYGLDVYSVEANPEYVKLLEKTAKVNDVNINLVHAAVLDEKKKITLNVLDDYMGSSSINQIIPGYANHPIEVEGTTLDDILSKVSGKVLIKMDIEGAEEKAFYGAEETNKRLKPTYVVEYTPGSYSSKYLDEILDYGDIYYVDLNGNESPITREQIESSSDWITLVIEPRMI